MRNIHAAAAAGAAGTSSEPRVIGSTQPLDVSVASSDGMRPEGPGPARRTVSRRIIVIVTVAVLIAAGSTLYAVTRPPAKVRLPDVVGIAGPAASGQLTDHHLRVTETRFYGPTATRVGMVLKETPPAGSRVKPNSAVTLEIVDQNVDVPDVTSGFIPYGTAKLTGLGVHVKIDSVYDHSALNEIIGQAPDTRRVGRGSTVTLRVSKGPKPSRISTLGKVLQGAKLVYSGGKWVVGKVKSTATNPTVDQEVEEAATAGEGE